jgi:glycosyltransferase involved in cell wall biosynthesis
VISTRHVAWATAADVSVRATRSWDWTVVDYDRASKWATYLRTGVRQRAAQWLARGVGVHRCPMSVVVRAYSRVHSELLRAAAAAPADFYYGGTTGALAAAAAAGRRAGVPYALDLEDFHSAEQDDSAVARLAHGLAERIEQDVLRGAVFLTASSDAIAAAYARGYGVSPIPIHNTFPLPPAPPDFTPSNGNGLRLCWFSQTIGPRRGLEDAVHAMGRAGIPGELHVRGRAIPDYLHSLRSLAARQAPHLELVRHEPCAPDALLDLCRGYDVGLAAEPGFSENNRLALSNKAFTYILAGLAVALTDTPGQRLLAAELGEGALVYAPGDVEALARGLQRWAADTSCLTRAKRASWAAAERRWHWEHPKERGALLRAVARVVG